MQTLHTKGFSLLSMLKVTFLVQDTRDQDLRDWTSRCGLVCTSEVNFNQMELHDSLIVTKGLELTHSNKTNI